MHDQARGAGEVPGGRDRFAAPSAYVSATSPVDADEGDLTRMVTFLRRPLRRAAAVIGALAVTAVLAVATGQITPPTSSGEPDSVQAARTDQAPLLQQAAADGTGLFPLLAREKDGRLFDCEPKGTGGWKPRTDLGGGYSVASAMIQANVSDNGRGNDL